MATIVDYALRATEPLSARPLTRVDALCLSWLAYLRLGEVPVAAGPEGVALRALADDELPERLTLTLHEPGTSATLVQALALSPRFRDVRACWYEADVRADEGLQFAAVTFVLPEGLGAYVAFRGTDNSLVGWQENLRLAGTTPVPAQRAAAAYLERVAGEVAGTLWVGGHSKGGNLAAFACGVAPDEVRSRVATCFSHDGPGVSEQVRAQVAWHDDVVVDKTVPRESLVGMLFERSQEGIVVVRSRAEGVWQHGPFGWEVAGNDFVCEQGLDYDTWRLARRLGDWLETLGATDRDAFVELATWLMETTGEPTFSGLLGRWRSNTRAMRAALEAGPACDRALFERGMDELAATLLLGSAQEYERPLPGTPEAADAARRRLDDATAKLNDRLARLDRLTGGA